MSNIVKKKQYDFVNLAKFISAVFVIGIHTSPLQGLHPKLNYFTRCIVFRLAVPFFFICSGYFLAEKLFDEDKKKVKDYVKKYILNILNIYILWSIIYTLLNFNTYFGDGNIIKNIILVVARFLFKGAYIQLWYL
ncbi:MAG: acyltransferase family protein, partial [Clostridia bacterium]